MAWVWVLVWPRVRMSIKGKVWAVVRFKVLTGPWIGAGHGPILEAPHGASVLQRRQPHGRVLAIAVQETWAGAEISGQLRRNSRVSVRNADGGWFRGQGGAF